MSQPTTYAPVVRAITVATSRDQAFKVFTEQLGTWWPTVRFVAKGPNSTQVELEHRGFERHGDTAPGVHGAVSDSSGWTYCLERFAAAAA